MKLWYCGNYGAEIEMTLEQARRGSHQGDCESDVDDLVIELKDQLKSITPAMARKELKDCGAWDDKELSNHKENLKRLVWIACGDITEEHYQASKVSE